MSPELPFFRKRRAPDLESRKRAMNPESGNLMPHDISRHRDFGDEELNWEDGNSFRQGSLFPKHVQPGDITDIESIVLSEYHKHLRGQSSSVTSYQEAGGADRVRVRIKKYGIKDVGAFIRNGMICTVFPED